MYSLCISTQILQVGAGSSIEPGLDSTDFRDMLLELYGTDPEPDDVHWTFQLASRGGDRCTSTGRGLGLGPGLSDSYNLRRDITTLE